MAGPKVEQVSVYLLYVDVGECCGGLDNCSRWAGR